MIEKLPRHLPSVQVLIDDLCCSPRTIARAMRCTPATVKRWVAQDSAPFAVHLSLFWMSRYGMSQLDAEAVNQARLYSGLAGSLRREVDSLRADLVRLARIADFGSANDPGVSIASDRPGSMPAAPSLSRAKVSALRVTIPNAAPRVRG